MQAEICKWRALAFAPAWSDKNKSKREPTANRFPLQFRGWVINLPAYWTEFYQKVVERVTSLEGQAKCLLKGVLEIVAVVCGLQGLVGLWQPQKQISCVGVAKGKQQLANSICNLNKNARREAADAEMLPGWANNLEWSGIGSRKSWFAISWQRQFAPHHRYYPSGYPSLPLYLAGWWSFNRSISQHGPTRHVQVATCNPKQAGSKDVPHISLAISPDTVEPNYSYHLGIWLAIALDTAESLGQATQPGSRVREAEVEMRKISLDK